MHEQSNIPTVWNLDGVYYRVVRDGNHVSRCFSDLSESEQAVIMEKYDAEQLRRALPLPLHQPAPNRRCTGSCRR